MNIFLFLDISTIAEYSEIGSVLVTVFPTLRKHVGTVFSADRCAKVHERSAGL